jgi:hypothetical protein
MAAPRHPSGVEIASAEASATAHRVFLEIASSRSRSVQLPPSADHTPVLSTGKDPVHTHDCERTLETHPDSHQYPDDGHNSSKVIGTVIFSRQRILMSLTCNKSNHTHARTPTRSLQTCHIQNINIQGNRTMMPLKISQGGEAHRGKDPRRHQLLHQQGYGRQRPQSHQC